MSESYKVRVVKDYLVFCAGHFISYEGHKCEGLHGHNYRAAVEIEGPLDENFYVVNFVIVKRTARALVNELDHKMLLATRNAHILLEEEPGYVRVNARGKHYLFPRDDCVLLPIENTTVELIATYLGGRFLDALQRDHHYRPNVLRVEVEESFGQSAIYEWRH
jgi:6-pyruvoyltetrahydropterin/6-carboxytetrahydropterin synthase